MKKIVVMLLVFAAFNVFANGHDEAAAPEHHEEPAAKEIVQHADPTVTNLNDDQIVSQPADCYLKQTLPCTFKSISRHKSVMNKTEFVFLKNAVVKITDFANLNLEPIIGGFIVNSTKGKVSVKGVPLTKFPSFADITKDQIEVVDGKDYFIFKFNEGETERYLLDREPFIKKLAGFYNNADQLKAEYKNISPIYNKSFKQDVAVHKRILSRGIASVEEQKKQEAERARRIREQQRKNKETFFKRTFVQ
ncbi:hypothetical protein CIK05_08745 [Bdellovibrio sp. qaytius]|nr:hypothetical protein CIK05_08745 [Bdellovibrio sp. qaytius]